MGKDKPLAERRVRSIAPARLRNTTACALGVVDDVLTRISQGVQCQETGGLDVVVGASMQDLDFNALLRGQLTSMERLVCECVQRRGEQLSAAHFDPVSIEQHKTVAIPVAKKTSSSTFRSGKSSAPRTSSASKASASKVIRPFNRNTGVNRRETTGSDALAPLSLQGKRDSTSPQVARKKLAFEGNNLERFNVGAHEHVGDPEQGDGWTLSCSIPDGLDQVGVEAIRVSQDEEHVLHVWFADAASNRGGNKENAVDNKRDMRKV